ncbi:cell division ATP-binding protein FtsE [Ruminococcus flavefaciens]|uniref:Cell division ATP-binding protein FtsE n=1 Tax=Ruminococcus flavefaciens TaxID=1265 RepID=A0A1M7IJ08_RUMFL|nr:cell division ATP-binding protein FtsE [Ruminococcus sp.]SHM40812.1 cell division ATP-binding protein FtsE [Ruminococcus flavefaciens]
MVELKNVSVTYSSGVDALNNVSLKINDGDFAFVVGSSGAGKSTMIKLLLKEIDATSGVVTVNGYNLNKLKKRKIPEFRRTLGFVFQDFRLIPSMTVYENIAFVLRVIDAPIKYIRKRVPYVISLVGLHAKTNSYPDELSGGEKQRVAIARALVNDPQLIIADEPTGNIDPELSYEIVELLKGINDQGTTILMVTHEHDLVRHFGGRIINITEGEIVFDEVISGANDELLADIGSEMPADAMAAAVSEAERINDEPVQQAEEAEMVNTEEAIDLPIENMTADDIISAIGGIPEGNSEEKKDDMQKLADNIDVDLSKSIKRDDPNSPEALLAALTEKTKGGAE